MPTNIAELRLGGASEAELATLQRLADELSADYTVFYSRHVADLTPRRQAFGEIDFVIVNQSGDVLLIEQKNGSLQEAEDDLGIRYAGQAPAVILTDIALSGEPDHRDPETALLWCGLTRATVACELLVQGDCGWLKAMQQARK